MVKRITLRRGKERRVVVVESGLNVELPQVGDTVPLNGEAGWRVCKLASAEVLARFPFAKGERLEL
jgi:hypothetical protein